MTPADAEYVRPLLDLLADPPIGLFVKGRPLTGMPDVVAVVGARNCSSLGNEMAMDIGSALGSAGACVVSGAARGIDAAAHRGALAAGGTSIAVLGSGIDLPYPKGSAQLLERIAAVGAVVTEYAPGVKAEPFRFPARNRLVAALSRALVVVEGAEGSGSMISVEHALDLGRDVFAVPGTVTNPLAQVPLALIREGATLIRGADDLLADLGLAARLAVAPPPGLPDDERQDLRADGGTAAPRCARPTSGDLHPHGGHRVGVPGDEAPGPGGGGSLRATAERSTASGRSTVARSDPRVCLHGTATAGTHGSL